jgi:ketosteroid isomerase-like protein
VALAVAYTGDTGQMAPPSRLSGSPVGAKTSGDTSVVTVEMHYSSRKKGSSAPAPPAEAITKVLMVRRDGKWYVATPQSFNPLLARGADPSDAALRRAHRRLLATAARQR